MHVSLETTDTGAARTIDRVESHLHLGADSQVDDRNVIITPMQPERTDPFVLLSEDWFSSSGFDWHPHHGLETVTFVLELLTRRQRRQLGHARTRRCAVEDRRTRHHPPRARLSQRAHPPAPTLGEPARRTQARRALIPGPARRSAASHRTRGRPRRRDLRRRRGHHRHSHQPVADHRSDAHVRNPTVATTT